MPVSRFTLVLVVASCALLGAATPTTASSGGWKVIVAGNCSAGDSLVPAIQAQAGVASVTAYDTGTVTPTAAQLAAVDVVVSLGNCLYADAVAWGDRLADYVDHGGVVIQAAYDNWENDPAHPKGRFASGGYAPLSLGPNGNSSTTLGTVTVPNSPIVQGLDTFATSDNTTTALAPGATLLALWADGRNAIAVKGRVVATSASAYDSTAVPDIARLAINAAKYFILPPNTKITRVTINQSRHLAAFRFAATGPATGFKCELKKAGKSATFKSCSSPKRYTHLAPGKYTFKVMAVGRHDPDPTPASKHFAFNS